MPIWVEAVRDIGFPAAVALILLMCGQKFVNKVANGIGENVKELIKIAAVAETAAKVADRISQDMAGDVKEMKEAMVATLEYFRNGKPPTMGGRKKKS